MKNVKDMNVGFVDVLKKKEFFKVFLAQTISNFGDSFTRIALAVFVYQRTNSAFALSFTLALQILPRIVFGILSGVLIDRVSRKFLLIFSDLSRTILIFLIPFSTNQTQIYIIAILHGTFFTIYVPTRLAVMPELTGKILYPKAASLTQMSFQITNIFGLAFGGILIEILGVEMAFQIDSLTFLASALIIFSATIPSFEGKGKSFENFFQQIKEGFEFMKNQNTLKFIIFVNVLMISFGGMVGSVTFVFLKDVLGKGSLEYGMLLMTLSFGILSGSFFAGIYDKWLKNKKSIILNGILRSLTYVLLVFIPSIEILMIVFFFGGIFQSIVSIVGNIYFAELTPKKLRGRVFSTNSSILFGSQFIAMSLAGFLTEIYGVKTVIFLSGVLMFLGLNFGWKKLYSTPQS